MMALFNEDYENKNVESTLEQMSKKDCISKKIKKKKDMHVIGIITYKFLLVLLL